MFLWILLGEYGLIFSHNLHDVAGVDDGTIMVQRGYPSALKDQEVLAHRKESPTYSNMMVDEFACGMSKNGVMGWQEPCH